MPLRIDVLKFRGQAVAEPASVVFDRHGGTVGRASDNRLVLPDEGVSRKHVQISFENGRYYLTDDSTNGTLICNSDLLVHFGKVELADGDILRIGDYEVSVDITEEGPATANFPVTPGRGVPSGREFEDEPGENKASGLARPAARIHPADPKREPGIPLPDSIDKFFEDIDDLSKDIDQFPKDIDKFFEDTAEDENSASIPEPAEGLADFTLGQAQVIDMPSPQPISMTVEHPKEIRDVPSSIAAPDLLQETRQIALEAQSDLFNLFLKGARIEDPNFANGAEIPELMEALGAVFRELVQGLWTILRGRTELKAEIRLAMTMVRPVDNSPLKLSPRIEDALKRLLKREHPSFLEPVDAVREGFEDVMNHQLAMNAGIQASLLEALEQFEPQRFMEKNKDQSPFQTKGKYWKEYCTAYPELKNRATEGIFGKAFVRAYEEQLERLRSKQRKS
jgi:type VI secretion system protein